MHSIGSHHRGKMLQPLADRRASLQTKLERLRQELQAVHDALGALHTEERTAERRQHADRLRSLIDIPEGVRLTHLVEPDEPLAARHLQTCTLKKAGRTRCDVLFSGDADLRPWSVPMEWVSPAAVDETTGITISICAEVSR